MAKTKISMTITLDGGMTVKFPTPTETGQTIFINVKKGERITFVSMQTSKVKFEWLKTR